MKKIEDLRLKINDLDQKILDLVIDRLDLVREIGRIKAKNGIGIIDKTREEEIIKKLTTEAGIKGVKPETVKKVWNVLMEISYEVEERKNGNG